MKNLTKYFLRGLFTLLPAGLTVVILASFLSWTESWSRSIFSVLGENVYFPGMGLLVGVVLIILLGFLTALPFATKILEMMELPFKNIPIVNSIYLAIKSLSDYFSGDATHADQQVVIVKYPGVDIELVGLITRKDLKSLAKEFTEENRIAVFLPLSYQVGGLTVFIPKDWVKKTDMRVEVAMRSALTAWLPSQKNRGM